MKQIVPGREHHPVRSIISSILSFFALSFISLAIVLYWLVPSFTDSERFVGIVGPFAAEPTMQDFVADQSTGIFVDGDESPVKEIAEQLAGDGSTSGKTDTEIRAMLQPIIKEDIKEVIASPDFSSLWQRSIRDIHKSFIAQIEGDSSTATLDFRPLIVGTVDMLTAGKLAFIKDKIDIKGDVGKVTVPDEQVASARRAYDYAQDLLITAIALAVIFTLAAIGLAVHRLKTARRILFSAGLSALLLLAVLSVPSMLFGGTDDQQQKFLIALVDIVTRDLRSTLVIVASAALGISAISWGVEFFLNRRA